MKNKKVITGIIGIIMGIAVIIAVIVGVCIENGSKSQFKQAMEQKDYDKATELYKENLSDDIDSKEMMEDKIQQELSEMKTAFENGEISIDDIFNRVEEIKQLDDKDLSDLADAFYEEMLALSEADYHYGLAEEYFNEGLYQAALTEYETVDGVKKNYKDVQEKMKLSKSEVEKILFKPKVSHNVVIDDRDNKIYYKFNIWDITSKAKIMSYSVDSMTESQVYYMSDRDSSTHELETFLFDGTNMYATGNGEPIYQINGFEMGSFELVPLTRIATNGQFAMKDNMIYYLARPVGNENLMQLHSYSCDTKEDKILLDVSNYFSTAVGYEDIAEITDTYLIIRNADQRMNYGTVQDSDKLVQSTSQYIFYNLKTNEVELDSFYACMLRCSRDEENVLYYYQSIEGGIFRLDLKTWKKEQILTEGECLNLLGADTFEPSTCYLKINDFERYDGKLCVMMGVYDRKESSDIWEGSVFFINTGSKDCEVCMENVRYFHNINLFSDGKILLIDGTNYKSNVLYGYSSELGLWQFGVE